VGELVGSKYRKEGTKTATDAVPSKPTTYKIEDRKRGTDVGRRGEREI